MRIAMVTEGTYPVSMGGVSTWCDQLITGMPEHQFEVTAIVATGRERDAWKAPPNLAVVRRVPMWGAWPAPLRWASSIDLRSSMRRAWRSWGGR